MLRLRTFGGLSLDENGQAYARAQIQRRRLALLALLAGAGERGLSRDKIYLYLWPESDPERARNALNQSVFAVRRDLGSDILETVAGGLRLNPVVITSDVAEFKASLEQGLSERAVALYGGPFLDGFHLADVAEFERWVATEREQLARLAVGALKTLATEAVGRGDHEVAAGWWRRLTVIDPLNTSAAIGLMNALAAAGDRAAALRHVRVHETLFREELGAAPDPSLAALAERLRRAPDSEHDVSVVRAPMGVPADVDAAQAARSATQPRSTTVEAKPTDGRRRRVAMLGSAALALGITAVTLLVRAPSTRSQPPATSYNPKRVLVAPFENLTGDRALEALGRMAADWIIYGLARTGPVEVVDSRTLVDASARAPSAVDSGRAYAAAMQLARAAGAGSVIWGSYYRHGDSLRIHARVVDTRSGVVVRMLTPAGAHADNPTPALDRIRQDVAGALTATR